MWPSQATYLAQQVWFTKKFESIFESAIVRKEKVAKDRLIRKMQADSDEEFSDESDDYASVHINEIDQNPVTQAATIEAQKKLSAEINQNSDNEDGDDDGEDDGDDMKSKSMNQTQ